MELLQHKLFLNYLNPLIPLSSEIYDFDYYNVRKFFDKIFGFLSEHKINPSTDQFLAETATVDIENILLKHEEEIMSKPEITRKKAKRRPVDKGKLTLLIDKQLIKDLKFFALEIDKTLSSITTSAITQYLHNTNTAAVQ